MSITKALSLSLLAFGFLAAAAWTLSHAFAANANTYRLKNTDICIPDAYAVPLPTAGNPDSNNYDVSEGYSLSASIDREKVARNIEGYKKEFKIGGDTRYQGLYLKLSPASQDSLEVEIEAPAVTRLEHAQDLFVTNHTTEPLVLMDVLKKDGKDGSFEEWGYCSLTVWNDSPKKLDCERDHLRTDSIRISYDIVEPNLHLHNKIDRFVKDKISQWRCE